jgi:hypothetical protein
MFTSSSYKMLISVPERVTVSNCTTSSAKNFTNFQLYGFYKILCKTCISMKTGQTENVK